ncbi:uncharacterized protein MELLADRAFT_102157 [Melampsora larici-populina 98AG31]|uniref:Uncharacterized protein n=1 Tax=Melampsora larici-populina (strain 98AG31 / pathotype 3-4-7) TaxID=747676 RepID=F4R7D7_MELLP|nr:uncharacterized protein MELLADRAFT_102157 [Melampsora larici-populina 98AG31]EGG11804.1 hypothetical protein MELLADRAFT_102157 [Melampsora larici-populina 98AG31]
MPHKPVKKRFRIFRRVNTSRCLSRPITVPAWAAPGIGGSKRYSLYGQKLLKITPTVTKVFEAKTSRAMTLTPYKERATYSEQHKVGTILGCDTGSHIDMYKDTAAYVTF